MQNQTILFIVIFILFSMLFLESGVAVEAVPGDSCAGTTSGTMRHIMGPELSSGGHMSICDGTVWHSVLSYENDGNLTSIGGLSCSTSDVLSFNGTEWVCAASGGGSSLWTESGVDSEIYYSSGNVGIGTSNPSQELEVSGDVLATSYLHSSDRRLKKEIKPIENSIAMLNAINGVMYRWIKSGQLATGVIAQDIQKVIPHAVHSDEKGMLSVDYDQLIALLIETAKEQQIKIDMLEKKVQDIENAK